MKQSIKTVAGLALIIFVSLFVSHQSEDLQTPKQRLMQSTTYTTTSTRSQNVNDLCPSNLDRSTLVVQSDVLKAREQQAEVKTTLGIDGNVLIGTAVNGSTSVALDMVKENSTNLGIFVGSFAVGLIIFLIIWPFLCCCCVCPSCCPSRCCQKSQEEQYSKCQLVWPFVVLVAALILTMGASIYGFTKVESFGPSVSNLGCSVSIFVDDLLNGNATTNGQTFFTGMNTLSARLNDLDASLSDITGNFSDLSNTGAGTSKTAKDNVDAAQLTVKQIPDATTPWQLTLVYNTPIDTAPTSGTLTSPFKAVLGDYTISSSIVGGLFNVIGGISTFIGTTKSSASAFGTGSGSVNGQLSTIQSNIASISDSVKKLDDSVNGPLKMVKKGGDNGNMGLQAYYGVMIGFSFFALLGALLTVCCDKYGCRHLMYFSCVVLFVATLIGFFLATIFSVIVPAMTWGCDFIDVSLSSDANFKRNFNGILGSNAQKLSTCMPYGDGKILDSLVSGAALDSLNNLTTVIDNMKQFNATQYQGWIQGNMTQVMGVIRTWTKGEVVDLDSTNYNILATHANPSYASWTSCGAPFTSDSWVPTNSPNGSYPQISCQVSSGNVGDTTTCSAGTLSNNGANTCGGCMNSASLSTSITTGASLKTLLDGRYTGSCTFNQPMSNIWTNYYIPKNTAFGPTDTASTGTGVLHRAQLSNALILSNTTGGVIHALWSMQTLFTGIVNAMSSINDLIDPKYGLVAGLNCRVFGQDFVRVQQILCGSMYYNMYVMRYAIGLSSYGVLFAMCCIVCTGVRHYKHGERKNKVGDAFFGKHQKSSNQLLRAKD